MVLDRIALPALDLLTVECSVVGITRDLSHAVFVKNQPASSATWLVFYSQWPPFRVADINQWTSLRDHSNHRRQHFSIFLAGDHCLSKNGTSMPILLPGSKAQDKWRGQGNTILGGSHQERTLEEVSTCVQQAESGTSQESQTILPEKALVRGQSSEVLPSPRKKLMTSVETALTQQSCCQRCHLLPYSSNSASDSDSGDRFPASEKFCQRRTRQRNHPSGSPFLVSCHILASSRD